MVGGVIFAVNGSLVGPEADPLGPEADTLRVSTVLFLLSMMALIIALHLLQRGRERYDYGGALASAAAFVGVALTAGGYILVFIGFLEGLGTILLFVGLAAAGIGMIVLAIVTLDVGVLPRWGGVALIIGNPLLGVLIIISSYRSNFLLGSWLVVVPWVLVGFAVFRAAGRLPERPSRVR
jgi:hypothetical protein